MIHCNVCYAWRPSNWNGYKWADEKAPCIFYDYDINATGTCSKGAIVAPKVTEVKDVVVKTNDIVTQAPQIPIRQTNKVLYQHQQEGFERFKNEKEIALFFEQGCGKSATILRIVAAQFRLKKCDALLIIAPNDVHHGVWAVDQIPQWLDVPYELQCLFGRGGAKEAVPYVW